MTCFMVNLSSRVVKMCGYVCKKKAKQFDVYMMYIFYHHIVPIGSMYGIFTYIWLIFMVYVGNIYQSHGSYGSHLCCSGV